jgi:transmembrane sensor
MNEQYFHDLVSKYLDGTATEQERRVVEGYYEELAGEPGRMFSKEEQTALKNEIFRSIRRRIRAEAPVVSLWRRVGVAVAVLIVLAVAGYWFWQGGSGVADPSHLAQAQRFKNDIGPAHQGATLRLAGGQLIRLDSAANGTIAAQGRTKVLKQDTALSYVGRVGDEAVLYNTVSTGKGEEYHVELADGTRVWLDAESSIHFPTSFPGKERLVEITGQAYFEVAHNSRQPFRVKAGGRVIEDIGTAFNVNAYAGEPFARTTLLEGSVKVGEGVILKPGQQARVDGAGGITVVNAVDLDEVMAWKNGRFHFEGSSVEEIMAQLSRWYDIEVIYHDKISEKFVAKISRDEPLSRMLSLLEMTKEITFTIEGKKITVYNLKQPK